MLVSVQLCKAQDAKVRLTSKNWQHELCRRFLHVAPKPNAAITSAGFAVVGQGEPRAPGTAPEAPGPNEEWSSAKYWQLEPCVRLRMLRDLCLAVLNTYIFR